MVRKMISGSIALLLLATSYLAQADTTGTVLITGANRGIGLELARQYADQGWTVIGTARRPAAADDLNALDVRVVQLDVTDPASVDNMADTLTGVAIDVLINNAGILPVMRGIDDIDIATYTQILDVNTIGPVRVTQALMPNLRAGDMKKIMNTTSGLGSISGNRSGGYFGYRESKAALNMFTLTLARELAPDGFTCIVVNPGWVRTDMGGPTAPTSVQQSASGIRSVISKITTADNGTFWNFEGGNEAW
ncbi:MAG: SDR family oxidoreductase [Woeseiaceae bacterium]